MSAVLDNVSAHAIAPCCAPPAIRVLVVGNLADWRSCGRLRSVPEGCDYVDLVQLDQTTLCRFAPHLVLSVLVSRDFDAVDVAQRLAAAQFKGMYRVVANDLPDAGVIRRDIRVAAPQLDFDLIVLPRALP